MGKRERKRLDAIGRFPPVFAPSMHSPRSCGCEINFLRWNHILAAAFTLSLDRVNELHDCIGGRMNRGSWLGANIFRIIGARRRCAPKIARCRSTIRRVQREPSLFHPPSYRWGTSIRELLPHASFSSTIYLGSQSASLILIPRFARGGEKLDVSCWEDLSVFLVKALKSAPKGGLASSLYKRGKRIKRKSPGTRDVRNSELPGDFH